MKKILGILISVLSLTAAAATYSKPTFNQAERLIGAVKEVHGDPAAYTAACYKTSSVYSTPTFAQIERLIQEVREGTNSMSSSGGRYLSIWDCETGLPLDSMKSVDYKKGDIYIVGNANTNEITDITFRHTITLHGPAAGNPETVCTNVVFYFTNSIRTAYADVLMVAEALNAYSGIKDGVAATGNILRPGYDKAIAFVTAIPSIVLAGKYELGIASNDGGSPISECSVTNTFYFSDAVSVEDTGSSSGGTPNLRPSGASYTKGVASAIVESDGVVAGSVYWYDGSSWKLIIGGGGRGGDTRFTRDIRATASIGVHTVDSERGYVDLALKGKTLQEGMEYLTQNVEDPEDPTYPSITSVTLSSAGAKEVGTSFTPSYSVSVSSGSYEYGPSPTGATFDQFVISDTAGNSASTQRGSFSSFTVMDDTSYRVTAKAHHTQGNVPSNNVGQVCTDAGKRIQAKWHSKKATQDAADAVNSSYVTGYRNWYAYIGTDLSTINSAFIRSTAAGHSNYGNAKNAADKAKVAVANKTKRIMIALPKPSYAYKYNKILASVIDNGTNQDILKNFSSNLVSVASANGSNHMDYNVWTFENQNGIDATTINIGLATVTLSPPVTGSSVSDVWDEPVSIMAIGDDTVATQYQKAVGMNIAYYRQFYGPTEVTDVFYSKADLEYYRTKGRITNNVSAYWDGKVAYPYAGQIVTLAATGCTPTNFSLKANAASEFDLVRVVDETIHINGEPLNGDINILSAGKFPPGTDLSEPISTLKFCRSIATNKTVVAGMIYYGQPVLAEAIDGEFPGGGEVTVRCLRADRNNPDPRDNVDSEGCVILMLERTSTNTGMRHWMCAYEYFNFDHWLHEYYPDGMPSYGTTNMPWYGIMYRPLDGHNEEGHVPLDKKYTAASLGDIEDTVEDLREEMTNTVIDMTGIHQGEPNLKQQYDKGNWTVYKSTAADKTVEIGVNAHTTETDGSSQAIAIGRDSLSAGSATVAVGPNSFALGPQAIAMGWRANAVGAHAISIGGAKKSGEDYYTNGSVNVRSDLNLAEGDYSIAIGYNVKAKAKNAIAFGNDAAAKAVGAVQLGYGTNTTAHTLQFEDVTIVKDGQVVGTAFKEPEVIDPTTGPGQEELSITLKAGTMATVVPSHTIGPGAELEVFSTTTRNYTLYFANVPQIREGLPMYFEFGTPSAVSKVNLTTNVVTRLPVRFKVEQPYAGLTVIEPTPMDDGYDWSPVVTNVNIVYSFPENKFKCKNGAKNSLQGASLHAGTVYKMTYAKNGGGTCTVDLLTVPDGKPFMDGTFFGEVQPVEYAITSETAPPATADPISATILYSTEYGSFSTNVLIEVITE